MPENIQGESEALSKQQAEDIGKLLNIVFNNATLYGGKHPFTQKSSADFAVFLRNIFTDGRTITLLRIGNSLYIDKHCVDRKINVSRFINHFQRTGIDSISFESGVSEEELKIFIQVCTDLRTFPTLDVMNRELTDRGVSKVLLNYVFFQKMTKDDAVVSKDSLHGEGAPGIFKTSAASEMVLNQVGKLFTLRDMLENPNKVAGDMIGTVTGKPEATAAVIDQLKGIRNQISAGVSFDSTISADEFMESVLSLTSELKQRLAIQKVMGKIGTEEGLVVSEVDALTYQTVIQIVREEYRRGTISVKRLSQIIRRVLPDVKDLKKLLPMLKEGLLADGMKLADFLQLTGELHKELENDGLMDKLEDGAKQIGLTLDEIVSAINHNPGEAAKIIVLASEISSQSGTDGTEVTTLLSDYIESVGSKMALSSPQVTTREGGKALTRIVHQIETQFLDKLKVYGVSEDLLNIVESQLSERFPLTINKLKAEWITSIVSVEADLSIANLARMLEGVVVKKTDFDELKVPIEKALLMRGFKYAEIESVFKEIVTNIEQKQKSVSLLKILLGSSNTTFFIQRLIKENLRYKNPFSCINISIQQMKISGSWENVTPEIVVKAMSDICINLRGLLRDLDLIGSLGKIESNSLFIILPMTNEAGAYIVKKRFEEALSKAQFTFDENPLMLHIILSVTPFDENKTKDYKSFIAHIKADHVREEQKAVSF